MPIRVELFTAPAHWASGLINGDWSGSDDEKAATLWAESLAPGYVVSTDDGPDGESGPGFLRYHDAAQFCPLAADCSNYVIHYQTKESTNAD